MNGVATGYLAIIGAVFCSHPNITYILGAYGMCKKKGGKLKKINLWDILQKIEKIL